MRGKMIRNWLLPLLIAGSVGACANNGVQPGVVSTSSSSTATTSTYGNAVPGDPGRVVAINDVNLAGSGGGGGSGNGPLMGGILGAGGGAAIGAATSHSVVGGVVGGILGAVGGAILGTIFDNHGGAMSGGGRGIEVTVQKDDGQTVRVAQRDDGDIQLGDRVQIVQGRGGVAKVVRDNARTYDPNQGAPPPQNYAPPPQGYRQAGNYPPSPPPGHGPTSRDYSPYGQSGNYPPPRDYGPPPQDYRQSQYNPQPQDDPRNGNLN